MCSGYVAELQLNWTEKCMNDWSISQNKAIITTNK